MFVFLIGLCYGKVTSGSILLETVHAKKCLCPRPYPLLPTDDIIKAWLCYQHIRRSVWESADLPLIRVRHPKRQAKGSSRELDL